MLLRLLVSLAAFFLAVTHTRGQPGGSSGPVPPPDTTPVHAFESPFHYDPEHPTVTIQMNSTMWFGNATYPVLAFPWRNFDSADTTTPHYEILSGQENNVATSSETGYIVQSNAYHISRISFKFSYAIGGATTEDGENPTFAMFLRDVGSPSELKLFEFKGDTDLQGTWDGKANQEGWWDSCKTYIDPTTVTCFRNKQISLTGTSVPVTRLRMFFARFRNTKRFFHILPSMQIEFTWEDPCADSLCRGNGTCSNHVSYGPVCACPAGQSGPACDIPTDCSAAPCSDHGKCSEPDAVTGNKYCECNTNYWGPTCEEYTTECGQNPCAHGTTCSEPAGGGIACDCGTTGYVGPHCEQLPDTCATIAQDSTKNCVHGICQNLLKKSTTDPGYQCACDPNLYTGTRCDQSVDLCKKSSPCKNGGTCKTSASGVQSCDCPEWYNGPICANPVKLCDQAAFCGPPDAICKMTQSVTGDYTGYTCTNCIPRTEWMPDPDANKKCSKIPDPCANNPCQHGQCTGDKASQKFTCKCDPGYSQATSQAPCTNDPLPPNGSDDSGLTAGAQAGIAVAVILVTVAVAGAAFWWFRQNGGECCAGGTSGGDVPMSSPLPTVA